MAAIQGTAFLTPIGKLVQGSVWELSEKIDDKTKKPALDAQGNVIMVAYFAIAIDKQNPEWPAFWNILASTAQAGFPQYFQNGNMPGLKDFAYKVIDGDGIDKNGKPNNTKPGFAGCWVVKFGGSFLPRCFEKGKYLQAQQLQDPRTIKPGYFIRVSGFAKPNTGAQSAGLYLNSDMVELNFVGEEIVFGRDAGEAFGAQQAQYTPQGAMPIGSPGTMAPAGAGGMPAGGMPGSAAMPGTQVQPAAGFVAGAMHAAGVTPGGMPGTQATPGGMPGTQATPGAGAPAGGFPFSPGGQQQQVQQQQPQYAPTPKAGAYTMQQFLDNGFNLAQLLQEGYFTQIA